MSQLNYPLAEKLSVLKQNEETYAIKSGLRYAINKRMLVGKIKFILGFIYLFSLIYFMVKLFT